MEKIIRRLDINKKYCVDTAIKLAGIVFTLWSTIALFVPFDNIIDEKYPWFVKLIFALLIIFAIFIFAYIICAVRVLRQNSVKLLDVGNNHGVYVQYGDVFSSKILGKNAISNKRNILISVNRCFDTIVDDDLISSRSLHGTAMRDLYTNSAFTHDSLNKKIQSKLKGSHCELINKCDKPKGNQLRYEAGCVAEIEANSDVTYFFLGLTCFDKQLHPYITDIEYVTAISKALDYCLKRNQGYPVIIPIIGGGMAGTNKSEQDILNYLVRLIIMNRQSINCDIHIVVRESARSSIAISELNIKEANVKMPYRNGNYCAFYVKEPFCASNLGAYATPDFIYYNTLRMWKGEDSTFPYIDSHSKTYNVRDGSNWDTTLKPRLHERLSSSKNIILFLSSITTSSEALDEEMNYGIKIKKLPVIVVYPDFNQKADIVDNNGNIKKQIRDLWNRLPSFKDNMTSVPTLHIPFNKTLIISALNDPDFMVNTKTTANTFYYQL